MACSLNYIPDYLHTDDKPIKSEFEVGEELYYRCKPPNCSKPYDRISLYDISHNRNFNEPATYKNEDVLYNINEESPKERYEGYNIAVLVIQKLDDENTYKKEIISQDDPSIKVLISLIHTPLPCMYPHSAFEIKVNEVIVDKNNYQETLNKKNKTYKNIRSDIRQELTSIIQTGKIDSSQKTEFIEEP